MGKILITDHALEQAAASVSKAMLNAIPSAEECRHEFSTEFEAKIQQLQEKERRNTHRRSIVRRVAAVFLAIVLGAGIWLATDSQARAAVAKWFREVYETHIVYRFTGEAPGGELPIYKPTWIPDGYEEGAVVGTETVQTLVYQKGEDAFTITYYWMSEERIGELIGTDGEGKAVSVKGNQGYFYPAAGEGSTNDLVWVDERANIQFGISAYLAEEDIMRMAESLKIR